MALKTIGLLSALPLLFLFLLPVEVAAQTFDAGTVYSISSDFNKGPESIRGADLDEDGFPDLVTADNGFLTIFFGDTDGNYSRKATRATRLGNAIDETAQDNNTDTALVDVNGDGRVDIVGANTVNEAFPFLQIIPNNPVGSFVDSATLIEEDDGLGNTPNAVRAAQLNPLIDQHLDLVATSVSSPRLRTFLGDGRGNFAAFAQDNLTTNSAGQSLAVGDFNEDGFVDVAVADRLRVYVFFGDGLGSFSGSESRITDFAAHREWDVAMRDMDGDEHLDLVVSNGGRFSLSSTQSGVVVIYGDGTGSLSGELVSIDVGDEVSALTVADFDHDGNVDIVCAVPIFQSENGKLAYIRGQGNRTFMVDDTISLPAQGHGTMALWSGDFDGNGRPDLALGNEGLIRTDSILDSFPGNLVVYLSTLAAIDTPTPTLTPTPISTATLTPTPSPTFTITPTPTPATPTPTSTPGPADVNLDGKVDDRDLLILIEQQGNTAP